jgi:AraC-like DNA-binding protein
MRHVLAHTVTSQSSPEVSLRRIWKVDADKTYDIFAAGRNTDEYVLLRTHRGAGKIYLKNRPLLEVFAGTALVFKHSEIERYLCATEQWSFWWFEFAAQPLSGLALNTLQKIPIAKEEEQLCNLMFELLRKNTPSASGMASAGLAYLLSGFNHEISQLSTGKNPHSEGIERAIGMVQSNAGQISISAMAHAACLSPRRFRQVFLEVTGKPPKQFCDIMRQSMAEKMLLDRGNTIAQVASRLGFCNQFHFSKAFHRYHGVSPSVYKGKWSSVKTQTQAKAKT